MYKNTGSATNIAIEISDHTTGKILGNGEAITQSVNDKKQYNKLIFINRYNL